MVNNADDEDHIGSIDYIQEELNRTERELQQRCGAPNTTGAFHVDHDEMATTTTGSLTNRLHHLTNEINDLNMIYELSTTTDYMTQTTKTMTTSINEVFELLLHDIQRLETLSKFLLSQQQQQQQQQQYEDESDLQIPTGVSNPMINTIYEQEYIPLYQYLCHHCIVLLRKQLQLLNYPILSIHDDDDDDDDNGQPENNDTVESPKILHHRIIQLCQSFNHLTQNIHSKMISIFGENSDSRNSNNNHNTTVSSFHNTKMDPLVLELCRPIVERIRYHFVIPLDSTDTNNNNNNINNHSTIQYHTKIERLPELLFGYIREYVFDSDYSPWDMVCHIHDILLATNRSTTTKTTLAYDFLNEMIRTIQYVFSERNFFRHPSILSGTTTNTNNNNNNNSTVYNNKPPIYLSKAIEQILQFDSYIQNDVLYSLIHENNNSTVADDDAMTNKNRHRKIICLMDVCIVGDEELLQWWLDRERESVLSTLFDDNDDVHQFRTTDRAGVVTTKRHHNDTNPSLHRISARAELFCALFRSIQIKANVFTYTGPYYSTVAVPMCIEFLDAIHETITDMKHKLLTTGSKTKSKLPTNVQLSEMMDQWIEVINGTHMAATMLTVTNTNIGESSTSETSIVNDDMIRFGRSLQHLQVVIIDDLITTIIETILMERCKFAAYLMRCSHLLTISHKSPTMDNDGSISGMSHDLSETYRIISIVLNRCWIMNSGGTDTNASTQMYLDVNNFASKMIRERILSSMAEKILEVALDIHGMTPDLNQYGCSIFATDAVTLLSSHHDDNQNDSSSIVVPEYVLRVLDIVQLMQYDSAALRGIGNALCGLSGQSAPLTEDAFSMDDRIYDEAIGMIRAKGFLYIELSDVINVLNRRRDL